MARQELKKTTRLLKNTWLLELRELYRRHDYRSFYEVINELYGPQKGTDARMRSHNGNLLKERDRQ